MSPELAHSQSADGVIARAIADAIRLDPLLSVWKWADEYRMLSSKAASAPGEHRPALERRRRAPPALHRPSPRRGP